MLVQQLANDFHYVFIPTCPLTAPPLPPTGCALTTRPWGVTRGLPSTTVKGGREPEEETTQAAWCHCPLRCCTTTLNTFCIDHGTAWPAWQWRLTEVH